MGITTRVHPFASTAVEAQSNSQLNGLFIAVIITVAFCFVPASYVVFVVRERETNSKHLQMISGVNHLAYWLSCFLFDCFCYAIPSAVAVVVIVNLGQTGFVDDTLRVLICGACALCHFAPQLLL